MRYKHQIKKRESEGRFARRSVSISTECPISYERQLLFFRFVHDNFDGFLILIMYTYDFCHFVDSIPQCCWFENDFVIQQVSTDLSFVLLFVFIVSIGRGTPLLPIKPQILSFCFACIPPAFGIGTERNYVEVKFLFSHHRRKNWSYDVFFSSSNQ